MVYVPPKYPSEIPTIGDLPDRQDDVHWIKAARYNELKKELRAALTELGILPKGSYADVKTRLDAIQYQSGCKVRLVGDQSVNSGSWDVVNFNNKEWDIHDEFDHITNHRFDVTKAGYYLIIAEIFWKPADVVADKKWYTMVRQNTVTRLQCRVQSAITDGDLSVISSGILKLEANDNIDVRVYQNSGAAALIDDGWDMTSLMILKIG